MKFAQKFAHAYRLGRPGAWMKQFPPPLHLRVGPVLHFVPHRVPADDAIIRRIVGNGSIHTPRSPGKPRPGSFALDWAFAQSLQFYLVD